MILLTLEESKYNIYLLSANAFVCLEIISNYYIKSKKIQKELKDKILKFKKHVKEYLDSNFEKDKQFIDHIHKKMSSICQPTNADKLKLLFEMFNLNIDENDKKILKLRNKYLHGNLTEGEGKEMYDFNKYMAAHRMASCLLAKISGYNGFIFSYDKFLTNQYPLPAIETVFIQV